MDLGAYRHLLTAFGLIYSNTVLFVVPWMDAISDGLSPTNFTLRHYQAIFNSPLSGQAAADSLMLGVSAATICIVLGVLLSYIITKTSIAGKTALLRISDAQETAGRNIPYFEIVPETPWQTDLDTHC